MFFFLIFFMIIKLLVNLVNLDNLDLFFYCIYGGVLCGIGYGFVFLKNGFIGGIDIIIMLIRKKYLIFNIGSLGFFFNIIIILIGVYILGIFEVLYIFILLFI